MRATNRPLFLMVAVAFLVSVGGFCKADPIEAVKGKHYKLTKRHGPWMIMVASILKPTDEAKTEGMSPDEAADELVYELRLKGIPAYIYKPEGPSDDETKVKTLSRRTQTEREGHFRWREGVCVLAGNYPSSDDKTAKKTLAYIKKFQPPLLRDVTAEGDAGQGGFIRLTKSGGVYRTTANRTGPLSGAFMTTNPMLSESEVAARTRDPLVIQLNSGNEFSLLQNKGNYTVIVATFQGTSHAQLGKLADMTHLKIGALDDAMNRAWELCAGLRRARSFGYKKDYDAYVYHDRYSSIVTVGSFNSADDPRIVEIQNEFGAKVAGMKSDGTPSFAGEIFSIPKPDANTPRDGIKTWLFDPFPRLIEVPK